MHKKQNLKKKIENKVFNFFIDSNDFNGIPLRQISEEFDIKYSESIEIIKELVKEDIISIQSSTNPHIIGFQHYPIEIQLKILEQAKMDKVSHKKYGEVTIAFESSEFPICLYPSNNYLKANRQLEEFNNELYTKQLALGEPHLKPIFFEIEVLERYANDPRFDFKFEDYSGQISCKYDEYDKPIVRKEDQIFVKTFGLGFDSQNNRLAVVYLRYLKELTEEHQVFWKSKETREPDCKILKEYHENTIQGNWTFSYSIFSAFIGELNCLNELCLLIFDKQIFRKSYDNENRPREFTFFFTPTLKNYNDFVLLLDKMLSDNINKDFFKGEIELFELNEIEDGLVEKKHKGTIRLFEEWLLKVYNVADETIIKDLFKPLKKIRRERQNPAHRISENVYDKRYIEKQKEMTSDAYSSIRAFRTIFQQHPKAKGYEVPDWLDNGEVKTF